MGAAVPVRHDDDFLAGEGLQPGIGILDDDRLVFLHQLGEEGDSRVDIILVAAQRLVQHLQPGIADPAIGGNANPALVFRIEQVLVRGGLARLLRVVDHPHDDQHVGGEPVLKPAARRLLGAVDDVLVIGANIEVVFLQTAAQPEKARLGLQHRHRRERRVAATRHRLRGDDRVDAKLLRHLDAVLLLEFRRVDKRGT